MNERLRRSEKIAAWYLMLFLTLVAIALGLNTLIVQDISLNEFILELSTVDKGETESSIIQTGKEITFNWKYDHKQNEVKVALSDDNYQKYKSMGRINSRDYAYYVEEWNKETSEVEILAKKLLSLAHERGYERDETIKFITAFVQSIPAVEDQDDYPKFSYETLYEEGGDCEDSSILLAKLLNYAGVESAVIEFRNHTGVGIKEIEGDTFYWVEGDKYFYIETTIPGYSIGQIPDEHSGEEAKLYLTSSQSLINPLYSLKEIVINNETKYRLNTTFENLGMTTVEFEYSYLIEMNNTKLNETRFELELKPNEKESVIEIFSKPEEKHRLLFNIKGRKINDIFLKTKWI